VCSTHGHPRLQRAGGTACPDSLDQPASVSDCSWCSLCLLAWEVALATARPRRAHPPRGQQLWQTPGRRSTASGSPAAAIQPRRPPARRRRARRPSARQCRACSPASPRRPSSPSGSGAASYAGGMLSRPSATVRRWCCFLPPTPSMPLSAHLMAQAQVTSRLDARATERRSGSGISPRLPRRCSSRTIPCSSSRSRRVTGLLMFG
jgi:hypothetical protein